MKQMTICFDESDNASYGGHSKKVFANNLAAINDVNSHCYSIKLKDSAIELIRTFVLQFYYRFNFGLKITFKIFSKSPLSNDSLQLVNGNCVTKQEMRVDRHHKLL